MKTFTKLKVIALAFAFLVGAVFIYSYYKLQSSELQKTIASEIENRLPGTSVRFGDFQYSLFPILDAKFDGFKIIDANKKIITSINEIKIELPIWAVLFDKGTVKIKIKEAHFSLTELLKIQNIGQSSADLNNNKENKSKKENKDLPGFLKRAKLNFLIENSQFTYEMNKQNDFTVKVKKIELKNASLSERFNFFIETDLIIKSKELSLNPSLKINGQLDVKDFLNHGEIICNTDFLLKNIEYNKFKFKELSGVLNASLKEHNVGVRLDSSWGKSSLKLSANVDIDKKNALIDSLLLLISPDELMGFDSMLKEKILVENSKIKITGKLKYESDVIDSNLEINTERGIRFKKGDNSFIDLPPLNIMANSKIKNEFIEMDIKTKFLDSYFDSLALVGHDSIKLTNIKSSLSYDNLWQLMPSEFHELRKIQKKQEGQFDIKGNLAIDKNNQAINLQIKNKGRFLVSREDEVSLLMNDLDLSIQPLKERHLFQVKNNSTMNMPNQPQVSAMSEISGDIDLGKYLSKSELIGSLNLIGSTQKIIKGKSEKSSTLKFIASTENGRINVSEMDGVVSLREALSFISLKDIKSIEQIDSGNSVATFKGKFQMEKNKILAPSFSFNINSPVSIKSKSGKIKLFKVKSSIDTFDENMNVGFSGESDFEVSSKLIEKNVKAGVKFKGIFKGKEYLENKKLDVVLNLFGITKESKFETTISYRPDKISINGLNANFKISELKTLAPSSYSEYLKMISPNNSNLIVKGQLSLQGEKISINDLSLNTSSPIDFRHQSGISGKFGFLGTVKNNRYSIRASTNVFSGEVVSILEGGEVLKLSDLKIANLFPKNIKISANNLSFENEFIKKFLYGNDPQIDIEGKVASVGQSSEAREDSFLKILPPFNVNLNVDNLKIGKEAYFSKGDISFKDEEFKSTNLIFKLANGYAAIAFSATLKDQESRRKINAKIYNFNLSALNGVLPSILESISGNFSGGVSGEMLLKKKVLDSYNLNFDLSVSDGELKRLNLTDYVKEIVEKIDITKTFASKLTLKVSDQFEKLILKGTADNKKIVLAKMDFVGIKNTSSIVGSGEIFQRGTKGTSHMDFIYKDLSGKIGTFLKNNVGKEEVPLKFVGVEFDLRPDYAFTIKQVGGNALKTQADKILSKEAEKLGNKLGDKIGEKAGDLFNKLFKKK